MHVKSDLLFILPLITLKLQWIHSSTLNSDFSDKAKTDIFISNYINEVEQTLRPDSRRHIINKRSTHMDIHQLQGVDLLVGFQEEFSLPVKFPNDIILFSDCPSGTWYATAIETNGNEPNVTPANDLILFKYQDNTWVETHRVRVVQGVRLSAEQIGDTIYIAVAEYHAIKGRGSPILYLIDNATDTLKFVQMLDMHFASDVIMWKWEDMEAFIAVAVSENGPDSLKRYSTLSPVYHWEGGSHWNMIGALPTFNPRALTQFTIGSSMFIAVANFQNDIGETAVDSEIFRFDLPSNKISLYQKLPTEAAVDIKYFCFQGSRTTERFLIYASAFHTDEEGHKDFTAASIIYKLSEEEYFVPFQALRVSRISSWQPVRHVKDKQESLTLLAAMSDGIASFQYDGWRFVSTGVTYDRTSFGPGAKIINVFYHQDQTLISVANKESPGYQTNVFRPMLKRDSSVENIKQDFETWEQRVGQQLATVGSMMALLLKIAHSAPSSEDKIVKLGSKITFLNALIDNVETSMTKVGENDLNIQVGSQLLYLNSLLETVQRDLKTLKNKIDQATFSELTLYEDIVQPKADIQCVYACRTDQLQVLEMNGESFTQFLDNTVNIKDSIEFSENVTFETLALTDSLQASKINGHSTDTLVDWSSDVYLENGLQVEGNIILKNNLSLGGLLDGVAINLDSRVENKDRTETVIVSPTKNLKSLNISQLTLSDGTLSGENFKHFQGSTLKTQGDQIFSEFEDFESLKADEVLSNDGVFKAGIYVPPSPFYSYCNEESSKENADPEENNMLRVLRARSDNEIEAISFVDNEITITTDFTIFGSVKIQNGSLDAQELVDTRHNVSANRLMEYGIPLDQPVIESHTNFHSGFEINNLSLDSINGVNISNFSLVDQRRKEPVVITARKQFKGGLVAKGMAEISGTVNGINISKFIKTLGESTEVQFENLTLQGVNSSSVFVGESDCRIVWMDEALHISNLRVESDVRVDSLSLQGVINQQYLENLLEDSVYNDANLYTITGKKHFPNNLNISKMNVMNQINGVDVSSLRPEYIWGKQLSQAKVIKVDNLTYSGYLDGIKASEFGEWMMTEGDQTIEGSQTIHSLSAVHANTKIVNSVNFQRLMTDAVYIFDNATLSHAIFGKDVESPGLVLGGRLKGLKIPEDLLLPDTNVSQQVSAPKYCRGNLTIQGDLRPDSFVSGLNISGLCHIISSTNSHIVITGFAVFKEEPNIFLSVNNKTWVDLLENIWFKYDDVHIKNIVPIYSAQFSNLKVTNINNNNVEERLAKLVSLSQDETVKGKFFFTTVSMNQGLEAGEATVGGQVQGLKIQSFVKSVMMDGEDQEITGLPDFNHLIIDGVLVADGLVNSLNLSTDVMLNNVPSNRVTAPLTLSSMTVKELTVPLGCRVARANVLRWNSTVVKKSDLRVITGDIVFLGLFDSPRGISIGGLVNRMKFDQNHIMLMNTPQQISGLKTFSPQSKLAVHNLSIGGFLNGINLTEFHSQQVTTSGNIIISGAKKLLLPVYSKRAVLPEIFQGHNLSWLDHQLSFPLPWDQYQTQLAALGDIQRQAELSISGRAYYLKNVSRVGNIEGMVLSVFPLKNNNVTVIGVIRVIENKTTLSLLHWSDEHKMFHDKSESVVHLLKTAPLSVQSVNMPGEEMAVYITRYIPDNTANPAKFGEILQLKNDQIHQNKIIDGQPNSKLLSFEYKANRTCFIVVADICKVYCPVGERRRIRLPSFSCQDVAEMCVVISQRVVYLVGLQNSSLVVWSLQGKKFVIVQSKPQFNPVSVATTSGDFRGPVIAVANIHRVGNSRLETIDLYRLNGNSSELSLEQQLPSISPRQVLFATLPSRERVLYVISNNPATPLEVFIYRGISGYIPFTTERTLAQPINMNVLSDHQHRHFVILMTQVDTQILQAQFQGGPRGFI